VKESKPAIAGYDAELIRKVIMYYIKYASPSDGVEEEKLLALYHRLRRL